MNNTVTINHGVENLLSEAAQQLFPSIDHLKEVTSTNDYLLKLSQATTDNVICITEHQTQGRGRRGQQWVSQPGDLCFSLLWKTKMDMDKLSGISLVTAIAIASALESNELSNNIKVKWPNDIFCHGKKLGGVLIESTRCQQETSVIIGIGINQNRLEQNSELEQSAISLCEISEENLQSTLIAKIINQLTEKLKTFQQSGLEPFISDWNKYDLVSQQLITVKFNQIEVSGVSQGINNKGELLLKTTDGELQAINSGSIQLK